MISKLSGNQRAIRVSKSPSNKESLYAIYNFQALATAMSELKPSAFKLWCYFAKNQNAYEFGLSSQDAQLFCNFSHPTYLAAFDELVKKGYLEEVELYPNLSGFLFRDKPYKKVEVDYSAAIL